LAQLFERFCDCVPQSPRTRVGEEDADQECDRDDSGFLPREKIIHEESLLFSQTPKNKEQQSESWTDVSAEIKEGLMQYVVGRFPPAFDATVSLGRLHGYFGGCEIIALHAILSAALRIYSDLEEDCHGEGYGCVDQYERARGPSPFRRHPVSR